MLARPQPRDKHGPPVGKLQRVMMGIGVAQVDLPKPGHIGPKLAPAWQQAAEDMVEFGFPIEHHLRAWNMQTATAGSPRAAKPRVDELMNEVVTSLSAILAGRDAVACRL